MTVIETIGDIMNQEVAERSTAVYGVDADKYKNCTPEELQTLLDCRVYRNTFHLTNIKSSTAFMREGEGENQKEGIENQCNPLHRSKVVSASNQYKPVQPEDVTSHIALSKYARIEEEKFFLFHDDNVWPKEMLKVRNSLLRDTCLDEEIIANKGNEFTLLPFLLDRYRAFYPMIFGQKESKFKAYQRDVVNDDDPTEPPNNHTPVDNLLEPNECAIQNEPNELVPSQEEVENSLLLENNISLYDMKWQDYAKSIFSEDEILFDLIITDPPYNLPSNPSRSGTGYKDFISDEEMRAFTQFCNRALKTGSYIVLFTSFHLFPRWVSSFKESQFKVKSYPFVVMKDHNTIQQRQKIDFPQNCTEFILLAKSNGSHPTGFMPDFKHLYNNVCTSSNKAFAGVSNLPVTKFKLLNKPSNEPVRVEEKNVDFILELVSQFSPNNGSIMDPYAGTFTSAIAAFRSKRHSVCIEKDSHCFKLAKNRLIRLLKPIDGYLEDDGFNGSQQISTVASENLISTSQSMISNGLVVPNTHQTNSERTDKTTVNSSNRSDQRTELKEGSESEKSFQTANECDNPIPHAGKQSRVTEIVPISDVGNQSTGTDDECSQNASTKNGLDLLAGCVSSGTENNRRS